MSKTKIKIALVVLSVIVCIICAVISLPVAIRPLSGTVKKEGTSPVYDVYRSASDAPKVALLHRSGGLKTYGMRTSALPVPDVSAYTPQHSSGSVSPFTYRFSSATVHSVGGGGAGGGGGGGSGSSSRRSVIVTTSSATAVSLQAVNTSAFSVNRDLNDVSGESVVGVSLRRIAPPGDGGSGIGGPGNIAPPGDGGEMLGFPVGETPVLLLLVLSIAYGLRVRRRFG